MESPCLSSSEEPTNICFFPPSKFPSRLTHIFWFVKFILASSLVPSTLHPKSFSPLIPLNVLVHPTPKKIENDLFHTENASNAFLLHFTGEIQKRGLHSENKANLFCSHHAGEI